MRTKQSNYQKVTEMSLFSQPKPRTFRHEYMFVDERKERLKAIEAQAKSELGMNTDTAQRGERIHGAFQNATRHVRRRRERQAAGGLVLSFGMIVVLLLLLFAVWKMLL